MNPKQWQWLNRIAAVIPELFKPLDDLSTSRTETTLGIRLIDGKHVKLSLVAEVVDPGRDPLQSHASVNYPMPDSERPDGMATPKPKNRKRAKRW